MEILHGNFLSPFYIFHNKPEERQHGSEASIKCYVISQLFCCCLAIQKYLLLYQYTTEQCLYLKLLYNLIQPHHSAKSNEKLEFSVSNLQEDICQVKNKCIGTVSLSFHGLYLLVSLKFPCRMFSKLSLRNDTSVS